MLAGRESLIRLIGKRRRNLSRQFLLVDVPQSRDCSLPVPNDGRDHVLKTPHLEESSLSDVRCSGNGTDEVDCVECPVCGRSIRGTNFTVNCHLDSCLSRGTKRKFSQRTLIQFCKKMHSGIELDKSKNLRDDKGNHELNNKDEPVADSGIHVKEFSGTSGQLEYTTETVLCYQNCGGDQGETMVGETTELYVENSMMGNPPRSCLSLVHNDAPEIDVERCINGTSIKTVIVGRKYHSEYELSEGASVFIVRDPENVKDRYALKVLCSDSGNEGTLGYLPKELSKYLSPLFDKYNLELEGYVKSSPKHHLDVVPVHLYCHGIAPYEKMETDEINHIKLLWKNVIHAIEHGKEIAPNLMKYQHNFHIMIQEVLNRHEHLFTNEEKSFIERFGSLSDDSQRIFIKLYSRKGPWFRRSGISYSEVHDLEKGIEDLQMAGFLCLFFANSPESEIAEVLDLLTAFELREISKIALPKITTFNASLPMVRHLGHVIKQYMKKILSSKKKQELVDCLAAAYEEGMCQLLPEMVMATMGSCIKISSDAELLIWRIQRLFFLNGEQDLSAFLLVDLGVIKYPTYKCNVSRPIFQNRNDLLGYEEAIAVAQIMDESIEDNNVEMVKRCIHFSDSCLSSVLDSSPTLFSCFSPWWVYSKVLTLGISIYERERRYEESVKLLKGLLKRIAFGGKRGYWTVRLSIDLEHMGYVNESLLVAEEGILDPWVRAGSRLALQRRILRLGKPPRRWKKPSFLQSISRKINEVHVKGRPLNCETGVKNRYYGYDGLQCGVEQLAIQYYAEEGGEWKGVHAESGIWMTIFGLLMWDIIFCDILDVFQTRFQTAPLDLGTDGFYLSREDLIKRHLMKIQDGMAEEIMICSWESHVGTACTGVNWDRHCLSDLRAIVSCISGHCLASLCRLLAQDYRSWSRGMPDLLLWRFNGDGYTGEAKLVEVKGPRDRLSEQQRAWILILMDCGFNTEVCRVSSP